MRHIMLAWALVLVLLVAFIAPWAARALELAYTLGSV